MAHGLTHLLVRAAASLAATAFIVAAPASAHADETDNISCHGRLTVDAEAMLDGWVNARIRSAVDRANRRGVDSCEADCLFGELRREIGSSVPVPWTWIPHSRFAVWIANTAGVDRCRLRFQESIYGGRPYNQPWLFPVTGRIIFLADSILLSGRVVGLDKIDHFIREGRAHHDAFVRGAASIEDILTGELGNARQPLAPTEHGLKGLALTGVVSYADLAASYAGFRFWQDLLTLGRPGSLVAFDAASQRFVGRRAFTFAAYVNAAWDESINRSRFHPALGRDVTRALQSGGHPTMTSDCAALVVLPDAHLYVNPECFTSE